MVSRWALRGCRAGVDLKPDASHAAGVAWQVVESVETVDMFDREVGHGFGRCEPKVNRDEPASFRVDVQAAPPEDASAGWI
jgi:hypothetical protein